MMTRNLKALGLVCSATLASVAFSAASASASGELFHVGTAHTIVRAQSSFNQVFTTPAGTVTCGGFVGNGDTSVVTPSQITIKDAGYFNCTTKTIFGTINVTFDFKGCDYLFTASTDQPTHIVCPAGSGPITIAGPGCTITIGAQTIKGVVYTNGASDFNADAVVSNIHSVASGFFCSSTGTSTTGTYNGTITFDGVTTGGAAVSVSYG